ncbi:vitelline membrane outer layer protein 1 homolog [Erpetoichthys calabaricus]|uniref:Vitelline membrane outer layer protein 1 homolog n=1 Tax=Erpetoichthys calabaricus TaxID=27687 RepID=A0A8C4SK03_ERPCA|nr:vitelline membrane outer layer protein 1 homolog [Erpetoichthys calabaricus]
MEQIAKCGFFFVFIFLSSVNSKMITVSNGANWGDWQFTDMCPEGMYARGFNLKVEEQQGRGDDTALNAIRLYCSSSSSSYPDYYIQSGAGRWGSWTNVQWCSYGFLTAFKLKVEKYQGSGDDTAANDIIFKCSNGDFIPGNGQIWGEWGETSNSCSKGIRGIQTRIEEPQGDGDDTALNDVRFFCD